MYIIRNSMYVKCTFHIHSPTWMYVICALHVIQTFLDALLCYTNITLKDILHTSLPMDVYIMYIICHSNVNKAHTVRLYLRCRHAGRLSGF